jgi:formiminotetrahydrofolate cyclodeaminase
MKGNRSFTTNKARKQEEHKRPKKKGTDEQTIKASVGQKIDRDREPLG